MLIDVATHGLFTNGLGSDCVVLDLGANEGDFSRQIVRRFGCSVIAVEPSLPHVQRIAKIDGVRVVHAAIGKTDGMSEFHVYENSQMSSVHAVKGAVCQKVEQVETISFEGLLSREKLDRVDVLKIDIEGSEIELFAGMSDERLAAISQISIELHDFNGMISVADADAIERRLARLGFRRISLSRTNRENVLFFNPRLCRLSPLSEFWARHVTRNMLGLKRMRDRRRQRLAST